MKSVDEKRKNDVGIICAAWFIRHAPYLMLYLGTALPPPPPPLSPRLLPLCTTVANVATGPTLRNVSTELHN